MMNFRLISPAFTHGGPIPMQHTCEGENSSPPLYWSEPPAGTQSFALIHDDPDDKPTTWVHWLLYNIPAGKRGVEEHLAKDPELPDGSLQGTSDFKKVGYLGPCPPTGKHDYLFKLYALDTKLPLASKATNAQLEAAMKGHVLAETRLMGTYKLKKRHHT